MEIEIKTTKQINTVYYMDKPQKGKEKLCKMCQDKKWVAVYDVLLHLRLLKTDKSCDVDAQIKELMDELSS